MPMNVTIGQKWSVWAPSRRQWLLSTVIGRENGQATLKYDIRYGMGADDEEQRADEAAMLTESNLFRFVET
jgi:hypothetical protein